MANLSDQLSKFNKQQEKLQASLAKHAVRPSSQPPKPPPASAPAPPPVATYTFANDKDKLREIAKVGQAPVGSQIKKVLELLLQTRRALSPEEINDACFVDVRKNKEVFESLKTNVKVSYDGQRFSYKSKHDLKDKGELIRLIRKVPEGIPIGELKDSYPKVASDIQELKASGEIWLLTNTDSQEEIVYPNDPRVKIKIREDLKQVIRSIDLPNDFTLVERELQKAGMKPFTNTVNRQATAGVPDFKQKPKQKKKRESKRTKFTNIHLPELFQNLNVPH